jgi:hypothetical protein
MANGLFDGSTGFGIDGGVKDASFVYVLDCNPLSLVMGSSAISGA